MATTTLTNADLLQRFAQENAGKDLKSTNQSGVVTDAPDIGSANDPVAGEIYRRTETGDDNLDPGDDLSGIVNAGIFQSYNPQDAWRIASPSISRLDNWQLGGDGLTAQIRTLKALNDQYYGGSIDSPMGKQLIKLVNDPMLATQPGFKGLDIFAQPAAKPQVIPKPTTTPAVVNPNTGTSTGGTAAPASGGNSPGTGTGTAGTPFEGRDLQTTLNEFLESDPNLALNAALNRLRNQGTSQTFITWFTNNFTRYWGEYQGMIAAQAQNGQIPDISFVDFVQGLNLDQGYHLDAGPGRAGTQAQRFTDFLAQGTG